MQTHRWHTENPLSCPLVLTIGLIGGKWKPIILHVLAQGTSRHAALRKAIPPISQKVLTQQLRELEADGLVQRTVYPEVPPRVEYTLTPAGLDLLPALDSLYRWGERRQRLAHADASLHSGSGL